jgi:hypothetical protein
MYDVSAKSVHHTYSALILAYEHIFAPLQDLSLARKLQVHGENPANRCLSVL